MKPKNRTYLFDTLEDRPFVKADKNVVFREKNVAINREKNVAINFALFVKFPEFPLVKSFRFHIAG